MAIIELKPKERRSIGGSMKPTKVEITGIDTSALTTMTEEEKRILIKEAQDGSKEAFDKLIMGNLKLVLSVIQRFNPKRESYDDLFQVGCIGLMKAVRNFDLSLGVRFSTYSVPMIIGEIRRFMRDSTTVRISRSLRDLAYKALRIKEDILSKEQRDATTSEIAAALGVSEKAVDEAMEAIVEPMSLYDSMYGDGEDKIYVIDKLAANEDESEGWIEGLALKEALKKLSEREMNIINLRFWRGRTQMEIASEIGISQAQVSRLEKAAIDKLRGYMQ